LVNNIIDKTPQKASVSQKIVRNTIYNAIGHFWGILVALGLIPYIIGHIGIERYGVWAIIGVLTGYFGLLDCGIRTSFVKYIAEYYAKKEYKNINQVVNTGLIFYLSFAVMVITLAFFIINPLLRFFKIPQALYSEAVFILLLGIILFAVSSALSVFGSIQGGLQRMDISNKLAIAISIPNIVGTIFFLERGYGLSGLMINNAIVLLISSVANIIIAFKLLPKLRVRPSLFNKETFKKLFSFGYKLQASKIAVLIGTQMDKLLITYFLNLSLVTFYQLGSNIINLTRSIPVLIISAIVPATSEIYARKEIGKLQELYLKSCKYLVVLALPLTFFITINASLIILCWVNAQYEKSVLVVQILAIGYFLNIFTGPGNLVLQGMGKPEYQMRASLIHCTLNLFFSIILIIKFGYIGVIVGTTLALSIGAVYFIHLANRELQVSFNKLVAIIYPPVIASICASFANFGFNYLVTFFILSHNRLMNISILALNGLIFTMVYFIIIFLTHYFTEEDKNLLTEVLSLKNK